MITGSHFFRCSYRCFSTFFRHAFLLCIATVAPGCTGPAVADRALEDRHIIDWHIHVAGLGYGDSGAFINRRLRENFRYYFFMRWMDVTEEELKEHGDALVIERMHEKLQRSRYVDKGVVLAMDGVIDPGTGQLDREKTQLYVPNDYIARETARYPALLFGASINPRRHDALERLEKAAAQGAVLVKWIPSIMHIDPADERLVPFYKKMVELNMPLLTHTGKESSVPTARDDLSDPLKLELPLSLGVTVIAAHIATTGKSEGQDNFERILPMFEEHPNLYTDISSLTQINKLGYLAEALRVPGLTEHMIYGTDWPLQYFPLVSPWYHVFHIGLSAAWRVSRIENEWDRDIKLKEAFGVPHKVFSRSATVLRSGILR